MKATEMAKSLDDVKHSILLTECHLYHYLDQYNVIQGYNTYLWQVIQHKRRHSLIC